MRPLVTLCLVSSLFGWSATDARAGVLRVGPSGAPYTSIQSAVTAAIDGDTILVAPGTYSGFTVHDESLTIAVDPVGVVTCGSVIVEDVSLAKNVVISSLRITATTGDALVVRTSMGSVRVQDCELRGADAVFGSPGSALGRGASVTDSTDVALSHCTVLGGHGYDTYIAQPPGADAIYARASRLALYGCTLHGGRGGWIPSDGYYGGGSGGDGLETPDSFVLAHATSFVGGAGGGGGDGDFLTPGGDGGAGGVGLRLFAPIPGTPPEVVTRAATLQGGAGGPGGFWGGSVGANGASSAITIGSVSTPTVTDVVLLTTSNVWRVGASQTITVTAPPGSSVALYLALDTRWGFEPIWTYAQQLAPPLVRRGFLGIVPASGILSTSFAVPPLPVGVDARTWHVQAFVSPFGVAPTSNVASVAVLAPGF